MDKREAEILERWKDFMQQPNHGRDCFYEAHGKEDIPWLLSRLTALEEELAAAKSRNEELRNCELVELGELRKQLEEQAIDPNSRENLCQENAMLRNDLELAQKSVRELEEEVSKDNRDLNENKITIASLDQSILDIGRERDEWKEQSQRSNADDGVWHGRYDAASAELSAEKKTSFRMKGERNLFAEQLKKAEAAAAEMREALEKQLEPCLCPEELCKPPCPGRTRIIKAALSSSTGSKVLAVLEAAKEWQKWWSECRPAEHDSPQTDKLASALVAWQSGQPGGE